MCYEANVPMKTLQVWMGHPMTWVRKMNSIRSRAEEIIRDELLSE